MNIDEYMDAAKAKNGLKSDRALDRIMGFKTTACSFWRVGKALPSPANMAALANLGGLDPHMALIELGLWNAIKEKDEILISIHLDLKKTLEKENRQKKTNKKKPTGSYKSG